jgi:hypothetical protein
MNPKHEAAACCGSKFLGHSSFRVSLNIFVASRRRRLNLSG